MTTVRITTFNSLDEIERVLASINSGEEVVYLTTSAGTLRIESAVEVAEEEE